MIRIRSNAGGRERLGDSNSLEFGRERSSKDSNSLDGAMSDREKIRNHSIAGWRYRAGDSNAGEIQIRLNSKE